MHEWNTYMLLDQHVLGVHNPIIQLVALESFIFDFMYVRTYVNSCMQTINCTLFCIFYCIIKLTDIHICRLL